MSGTRNRWPDSVYGLPAMQTTNRLPRRSRRYPLLILCFGGVGGERGVGGDHPEELAVGVVVIDHCRAARGERVPAGLPDLDDRRRAVRRGDLRLPEVGTDPPGADDARTAGRRSPRGSSTPPTRLANQAVRISRDSATATGTPPRPSAASEPAMPPSSRSVASASGSRLSREAAPHGHPVADDDEEHETEQDGRERKRRVDELTSPSPFLTWFDVPDDDMARQAADRLGGRRSGSTIHIAISVFNQISWSDSYSSPPSGNVGVTKWRGLGYGPAYGA